jgi:hypothetical protein
MAVDRRSQPPLMMASTAFVMYVTDNAPPATEPSQRISRTGS